MVLKLCFYNWGIVEGPQTFIFKYENMTIFCFYCGRVNHTERHCWTHKGYANSGKILDGQFGELLKADMQRVGLKHYNSGTNGRNEDRAPIKVIQQPLREGERVEEAGAERMRGQQGNVQLEI